MNENENRKMDHWKLIMATAVLVSIIGFTLLQEQPAVTQAGCNMLSEDHRTSLCTEARETCFPSEKESEPDLV